MSSGASDNQWKKVGAAAAGVGLAVALGVAVDSAQKRSAFAEHVKGYLTASRVELLGSTVGREAGQLVWILTVLLPNTKVLTFQVPPSPRLDPFSIEAAQSVTAPIIRYLLSNDLLTA